MGDASGQVMQTIWWYFLIAAVVSIGGIILFFYISRMLSARISQDLDGLKSELSRKLEVHRLLHQFQADAIDKLYIMLAKIARETAMIADYHKGPADPHRQFKLTVLVNTFHQLADHVHETKLYFPDNTVSRLQSFLTELREALDGTRPSIVTQYSRELHLPGQAERWSKVNYDLTLLLNDVQNLARGIIGLDNQGEPVRESSLPSVGLGTSAPSPGAALAPKQ